MIFKTNLMCDGCKARIQPVLDRAIGPENWSVDLNSPDKTLSIKSDKVEHAEVERLIQETGYQIELMNQI